MCVFVQNTIAKKEENCVKVHKTKYILAVSCKTLLQLKVPNFATFIHWYGLRNWPSTVKQRAEACGPGGRELSHNPGAPWVGSRTT